MIRDRPFQSAAHDDGILVVGIRVGYRSSGVIHMVDPTPVFAKRGAHAEPERVVHDGTADRAADLVGGGTVFRGRELRAQIHRVGMQVGGWLDESDRAPFGTCSEQRALRSPQYLDAFEIE